jgi:uncharacterized protein YjbJ (UPF0337 family)
MGFLDKLLGRDKETAGDTMGDAEMQREGAQQKAEGEAEPRAQQAEDMAPEARTEAPERDQP